jgi:putative oxidoreductase
MSRRTDDTGKLVLRLTIGGLLIMHGLPKIRDNSFVQNLVVDAGLPAFVSYGVFVGEIVAPVLLIIGLFTRTAALLVVTDMLFALWLVHSPDFGTIAPTGAWAIETPLMFLLGAATIAMIGPGKFAVAWNPTRDLVWSEPRTAGVRTREISATPVAHGL